MTSDKDTARTLATLLAHPQQIAITRAAIMHALPPPAPASCHRKPRDDIVSRFHASGVLPAAMLFGRRH